MVGQPIGHQWVSSWLIDPVSGAYEWPSCPSSSLWWARDEICEVTLRDFRHHHNS
jgi:hypothetical protein